MGVYMAGLMFLLFTLGMGGPMGQTDEVIINVPPAQVYELSSDRTFGELKPSVPQVLKLEQSSPSVTTTQRKGIGSTGIVVIALALLMFGASNGGD